MTRSLIFHLVVIPGIFLSGWLFASVKLTGFHTFPLRFRSKSRVRVRERLK